MKVLGGLGGALDVGDSRADHGEETTEDLGVDGEGLAADVTDLLLSAAGTTGLRDVSLLSDD